MTELSLKDKPEVVNISQNKEDKVVHQSLDIPAGVVDDYTEKLTDDVMLSGTCVCWYYGLILMSQDHFTLLSFTNLPTVPSTPKIVESFFDKLKKVMILGLFLIF